MAETREQCRKTGGDKTNDLLEFLATPHLTYYNVDRLAAYLPRTDTGYLYQDSQTHPLYQQVRHVHEGVHASSVPRTTMGISAWYSNLRMVELFVDLLDETRKRDIVLAFPLTINLFSETVENSIKDRIRRLSDLDEVCISSFSVIQNVNEGFTLFLSQHLLKEIAEHTNAKGPYKALQSLIGYSFMTHGIPFDIFLTFRQFESFAKILGIESVEPIYVNATSVPLAGKAVNPWIVLYDPEFNPYFRLHRMAKISKETLRKEKDGPSMAISIARHFGWPDPLGEFDRLGRSLLYAARRTRMFRVFQTMFDAHFHGPMRPPGASMTCVQSSGRSHVMYHPLVKERGLEEKFADYYGLTLLVSEALRHNVVPCPFRVMECFKGDRRCTLSPGKKLAEIGDEQCWLRKTLQGIKIKYISESLYARPDTLGKGISH